MHSLIEGFLLLHLFLLRCKLHKFLFQYFKLHLKQLLLLFQSAILDLNSPRKLSAFPLKRAALFF